jgi:calcium-dependent protein kinase
LPTRPKTLINELKKSLKVINSKAGTINIEISPQSFISENSGKFSDYYRIISRIGEGGYGQVFKVQNKKSGLIRAMKSRVSSSVIARSRVEKKNQGKMLFEFKLLRSIDHPHIIRMYEFFTDDKNFYLITE